jgi:hypothetical protein
MAIKLLKSKALQACMASIEASQPLLSWPDFTQKALGQSQWSFIRVSWTLIMLMWHHIYEERDDKSFIGAERVSWG